MIMDEEEDVTVRSDEDVSSQDEEELDEDDEEDEEEDDEEDDDEDDDDEDGDRTQNETAATPKAKAIKAGHTTSSKKGRAPSVIGLTIPFRTVKKAYVLNMQWGQCSTAQGPRPMSRHRSLPVNAVSILFFYRMKLDPDTPIVQNEAAV